MAISESHPKAAVPAKTVKARFFLRYNIGLVSLMLVSLFTCEKDDPTVEYFVDSNLAPYFSSFALEAQKRGLALDMSKTSGVISDIPDTKVLGRCEHAAEEGGKVTIDLPFWQKATQWEKEYVIFHELGHCVLNRRHLDDKNADGACVSMMQSGDGGCRMIYNAQTRNGYLDELFSQ